MMPIIPISNAPYLPPRRVVKPPLTLPRPRLPRGRPLALLTGLPPRIDDLRLLHVRSGLPFGTTILTLRLSPRKNRGICGSRRTYRWSPNARYAVMGECPTRDPSGAQSLQSH